MFRALLASIFLILAASATGSGEILQAATSVAHAEQFAGALHAPPQVPQGQDTADIEKQPCFNARHWDAKAAAIKARPISVRRHDLQPALGIFPSRTLSQQHFLFLYACAPRAPPLVTGI